MGFKMVLLLITPYRYLVFFYHTTFSVNNLLLFLMNLISRTNNKQQQQQQQNNIESKRRPATLTINFVSFVRIVYFLCIRFFFLLFLRFLWEVICGFEKLNIFPTENLLVHGPSELISILPERIHTIHIF